eukprot:Lithocolla_globosa_v1_NODE_9602_length_688_cov_209.154818.p1 type:complete len:166 gc:universal NODE_9602_length_688_cov_209.154818:552-55(-)
MEPELVPRAFKVASLICRLCGSFAMVECFVTKGVRVNGHVSPKLLATLSHGLTSEKKKRDERGWYCEKHIPLCSVLNVFTSQGWKLETSYECLAIHNEKEELVNLALFSKQLKAKPKEPQRRQMSEATLKARGTNSGSIMLADDAEVGKLLLNMSSDPPAYSGPQ